MEITFLLRGLVIGFLIAAPIGPVGVLCIRITLVEGRMRGLISGLGAATADAIYGCVAGLGLTFISNILTNQGIWLHIAGGLFLCYLGIKFFLDNSSNKVALVKSDGIFDTYASTFFLTLANPMTILSFMSIFAALGLSSINDNFMSTGALILGIFTGSALWWLILSYGVGLFRKKLNLRGLQWVNRIAGIIIIGFGLFVLPIPP